jgi:predicted phosphoribosyltransferase
MLAARLLPPSNLIERAALREKLSVFRDRVHAGAVLAELLTALAPPECLILAIPAGGVPVAAELAQRLNLPLDVAVVSKITLPWNTEAGFGAVAFDGSVRLNEGLIERLPLSQTEIDHGIESTRAKVARRVSLFRGQQPPLVVRDRPVILVDDGLASGLTMQVAVAALRALRPKTLTVAIPTAHTAALDTIAATVDTIVCANVRSGWRFAVAEAYEHWSDVDEDTALHLLRATRSTALPA